MGVDRTVTVRLRAVNDAYRRAMAEAAADTTRLGVVGSKAFKDLGTEAYALGSSLERRLTLPLLAIGVAAVKMGNDFEMTFGQMVGLADVPRAEVEALKQSVLGLASETAQGPQGLAKALYYVRSAGMDAADANEILATSAKASTAGMGPVADIAKAITFAVNAYGSANLSAARAGDILASAVREGTLEAADLTTVMGQVIPMASSLGISFENVAATMAVMSRNGTTSYQAVTGITAVMSTLLSTSKEGEGVLAAHGLSLAKLRDIAAGPTGLVGVFRTLDEAFQGNEETLAQVVPNIRALRTFLNVLSQDAGKVDEVMRSVANSTGSVDYAFRAVAETKAFRIQKDLNEAKIALTNLGAALAPIVADLADIAGAGLAAFSALPDQAQSAAVAFGVLLLVLGPVVKMASALITNWGLVAGSAAKLGASLQGLATYFVMARDAEIGAAAAARLFAADAAAAAAAAARVILPVIAVAYAVTTLVGKFQENKREARENADEIRNFATVLSEAATVAEGAGKVIADALNPSTSGGKYDAALEQLRAVGLTAEDVTEAILAGGDAIEQLRMRAFGLSAAQIKSLGDTPFIDTSKAGKELNDLIDRYLAAAEAVEAWRIARVRSGEVIPGGAPGVSPADIAAAEAALGTLPPALDDTTDAAKAAQDAIDAMLDTFSGMIDAVFGAGDQQRGFADAVSEVGKSSTSAAGSVRNLVQEERDAIRSAEAVTAAKKGLLKAEEELAAARQGASEREKLDANLNVQGANLGVRDAMHAVTQARKNLTEEQRKAPRDRDLVGAKLALAHAELNLRKAQLAAKDAQAEQNETMNAGAEGSKKVTDAVDAVEQATLRVRDAQWQQEAQQDKTTASVGRAVDAQKELAGQIDTVIDKGQSWIEKLIKLGAPGGEVLTAIATQASAVQGLIDKYGDANGLLHKQLELLLNIAIAQGLPATVNPESGFIYYELPKRARGGPVSAGESYIVGEHRAEVFTPGASGFITPQVPRVTAMSALVSGASGGSTSMSAPVTIGLDGRALARFLITASHDDGGWNMKIVQR